MATPVTAHWYLGSQLLGTSEYLWYPESNYSCMPRSTAYFCPRCGEVWGRIMLQHSHAIDSWKVVTRRCEKHGSGFFAPLHKLGDKNPNERDAVNTCIFLSAPMIVKTRELLLIPVKNSHPNIKYWMEYNNCKQPKFIGD